ncbi:MAG: HAMP domain-containing histidine kinase [Ruminococcus sp.]|nr:HAMP domain-containing histidine kinase [Ruminococcus sp.]
MTAVIFGIIAAVSLLLLFLHRREIRSISSQLRNISLQDSNELIHSESGVSDELINSINSLIKESRSAGTAYQRKAHDLEQMMINISHDLRTPLASAMGYINIITTSDLPREEKDREIQIVEQRLIRLEELINSFFEFSKTISGGQKPELSRLNLAEILQGSIVHYYDDYCSDNREISLDCPYMRIPVISNRNMLTRIFDNLIGNAYKHGYGTLSVKTKKSKNDEMISIRFENEAADPDIDAERVFDEFYTTDISRTKGNTGLGLAIAKQFTQMLGGDISAEYDKGIFSVTVSFDIEK